MRAGLDTDLPLIALTGDRGIDVFRRAEQVSQRRVRYECIATLPRPDETDPMPALAEHVPAACRPVAPLWRAIEAFRRSVALQTPFALGDPPAYPSVSDPGERLTLMMAFDFVRARLVADLGIALYERQFDQAPEATASDRAQTNSVLRLVLEFNLIERGMPLLRALAPVLVARVATPGFDDGEDQPTGYALRMIGDMMLRAGDPAAALTGFEASVAAGDNPYRRRRAIAAAEAAGDTDALRRHLEALARRGPLPDDLAALAVSLKPPAKAS